MPRSRPRERGQAARELLEREIEQDYQDSWTSHYAQKEQTLERDFQSVVIFRIGLEWLALPTRALDEVLDVRAVHSLPHRRSGTLLGVVSVRGELLVCVSLARVLGLEEAVAVEPSPASGSATRMLAFSSDTGRFVSRVDEVHGTHRVPRGELIRAPATLTKAPSNYATLVFSWDFKSVGLLDEPRLFAALDRSLA